MIPSITSLSSSCFSINQTPFSLLLFFITIHLQFQSILVVPMETPSEHVCYIHCSFCNTILAVSVPCTSLFNIVTVRCGHCTNLLSVNMGSLLQTVPIQDVHQNHSLGPQDYQMEIGSSSKCSRVSGLSSVEKEQPRMPPIRPPEKRQRVPSAYNRFIKEEIQRIKSGNPEISHREAFSMAAKNWAHFPHIHFGLTLEGNKQTKTDEGFVGGGAHQMAQNFQ